MNKTQSLTSQVELPAVSELIAVPDLARQFVRAEKSENTRRAYKCDNAILAQWCSERGLRAFPLAPGKLAEFLASQAHTGIKAMTLVRRVAAIRHIHRALGLSDPFDQVARSTLAGIRNKLGVKVNPHNPLIAADLIKIIEAIPFDGGKEND